MPSTPSGRTLSAVYANADAYPTGPIKRGGVTDKLLADYPNLFGDHSANSSNSALSRDPEFTSDFLKRHQDKLIFGQRLRLLGRQRRGASLQERKPPLPAGWRANAWRGKPSRC